MARRRGNTFNKKVIDALVNTPFILLGPTKRQRKSEAVKRLDAWKQAYK
jgi:hypothetical protein